jgi:hypothetical protein
MLTKKEGYYPTSGFDCFENSMLKEFQKNADDIEKVITTNLELLPNPLLIKISIFRFQSILDYTYLLKLFKDVSLSFRIPNVITVET